MKKRFSIAYKEQSEVLTAERRFAYTVSSGFTETAFSLAGGTVRPETLDAARRAGLAIEALRLPTEGVDLLWSPSSYRDDREDALPSDARVPDDTTWEMLLDIYTSYFTFAASVGIERVILTPSYGKGPAPVSQTALARFRKLAECAESKGIRLLIENGASAPHFEAAVRVCCESGFHGVSFVPAIAFRHYGTSAIPPYVTGRLARLSLDDIKDGEAGYLPLDGDTDFRPFAKSLAPLHFRGTLAISPNAALPMYREYDYFGFASRAYDRLSSLLRLMKNEEGVV